MENRKVGKQKQRHLQSQVSNQPETILVMQGGGSLGAYECGVYKTLAKHNIKFDIIAGTSIGAVNAAIIVANTIQNIDNNNDQSNEANNNTYNNDDMKNSAQVLEDFWLDAADNIIPTFLPFKIRSYLSAMYSFTFGNSKTSIPIWFYPGGPLYHSPFNSPYLYDTTKLRSTLHKYIDFRKLSSNKGKTNNNNNKNDNNKGNHSNTSPRLILTCTDIQKAEPVIFDSNNMNIDEDHVTACTGYPFYGLPWLKKDNRYLWDGSLLSNTPIRAVMKSSPFREKRIFVCDTFPHNQQSLPRNMAETWHRARDIIFLDKTTIREEEISYRIKKDLEVMKDMHNILNEILNNNINNIDEKLKDRLDNINREYNNLIRERGLVIDQIARIQRKEEEEYSNHHFLLEDADFSINTIKELIKQGEEDCEQALVQNT